MAATALPAATQPSGALRRRERKLRVLWACMALVMAMTLSLWFYGYSFRERWMNVPPAPSGFSATASVLGDAQMAYRVYGLMLQNMGDYGGHTANLREYDYNALGTWLNMLDLLDPRSDYVPLLAAFYFGGATDVPEKLPPLVEYLRRAGSSAEGEKWRWLAQAVYIARYRMNDMDKALSLAQELAENKSPNLPAWAKNMPALILSARGEKEAAYALLLEILRTQADTLSPYEVTFTLDMMCNRLQTPEQADANPLCKDVPRYKPLPPDAP